MSETSVTTPSGGEPSSLRIHYIKCPEFRTMHVDGMLGGPTPQGQINVAVFAERLPIPTSQVFGFDGERLGAELPGTRTGRDGIVRELGACLVMNLQVARSFHAWLGEQIGLLDKLTAEAGKSASTEASGE